MAAEASALGEKELERSMITENNERMRSHVRNGEILIAEFMDFLEAVDNNDPQIGLKFDEKAMKKSALDWMNTYFTNYGGNEGGLAGVLGEDNGGVGAGTVASGGNAGGN